MNLIGISRRSREIELSWERAVGYLVRVSLAGWGFLELQWWVGLSRRKFWEFLLR